MGRILAVDYGDARTGLAVSDPFGWTAQGLETHVVKKSKDSVYERINAIIREYGVERIVVGYPLNMDGSAGPRAFRTDRFVEKLRKFTDTEVITWDERLSSSAAGRTLHEAGIRTGDRKELVDKLSAVYILQGYLTSIANKKT